MTKTTHDTEVIETYEHKKQLICYTCKNSVLAPTPEKEAEWHKEHDADGAK